MSDKRVEKEKIQSGLLIARTIIIAIVGGVIWSTLLVFLYYFNFSEVAPKTFLVRPWLQAEWTDRWQGHLLSIFISGIISIIPSLIYYILFKKINSMWVGVGYGIILWCILFLLLNPFFTTTESIFTLSTDTIVTTLSIFILYGTFIGYSIAYDYLDMKINARKGKLETAESKAIK